MSSCGASRRNPAGSPTKPTPPTLNTRAPPTHINMSGKLGKNEAKRAAEAARKELDSEMTEEERERMLRKGMGIDSGGLQKGEERLAERKLTKEEKKAQTEAKRAALAEKKAQIAAMRAAIDSNRQGERARATRPARVAMMRRVAVAAAAARSARARRARTVRST